MVYGEINEYNTSTKFEKENHAWGIKKEKECLPFIREILGANIIHDEGTFNDFDYYNNKYNIELKSRTVSSSSFLTTYTTENKRMKANKSFKTVLWIFNFTDGLYYLNFKENKDTINSLKVEMCHTKYGIRKNINIPTKLLKKFNKTEFE